MAISWRVYSRRNLTKEDAWGEVLCFYRKSHTAASSNVVLEEYKMARLEKNKPQNFQDKETHRSLPV